MQVDLARVVLVDGWSPLLSRYTRRQGVNVQSGPQAKLLIHGYNIASGGTDRVFASATYTLLLDGQPAGTITPGNAIKAAFTFDATAMRSGWVEVRVLGDAGESCLPYYILIDNPALPIDEAATPIIPFATGSYDLSRNGGIYTWGTITGHYSPRPYPLALRNPPQIVGAPNPARASENDQFHTAQWVPFRYGDEYRVESYRLSNGQRVLTTFGAQDYHYSDMVRKYPATPHLDGPRNVGTVSMVTHLEWGRKGLVGTMAHRVFKLNADGSIKTLAGARHAHPSPHWQSPGADTDYELVGDWSSVPTSRRGFFELWGFTWDKRTLEVNESAAPIPSEGNEKPHIVGPVAFVADSQHNRICKLQWAPDNHADPVVSEFLLGLADPWDCVCQDGVLYVSERLSHRIAAYDATTGALLRVVVQGPDLAFVDKNRQVVRRVSFEGTKAAPCVAPEGLAWHDGWLYFTSVAQCDIRRVRPDGSDLQIVASFPFDNNLLYAKISVSDGCVAPGTIVLFGWSSALGGGMGRVILPDGTTWPIGVRLGEDKRGGGWPGHFVYATAGCIGSGGIAIAGANEGVMVITRRLPDEPLISAAAKRGEREFRDSGLITMHGQAGFGWTNLPLPFDASPDVAAYLIQNGHTQGA